MSDDIGRIIRRDLDLLPTLPRERWIPSVRPSARAPLMVRRLATALAVIALAMALGAAINGVRTSQQQVAATPAASLTALPNGTVIISRDAAIGRVRGLSAQVVRVDRVEAKLVSDGRVWRVALAGQIACGGCVVDMAPFRSALYTLDATTGDVLGVALSNDDWPQGFDALQDEAR